MVLEARYIRAHMLTSMNINIAEYFSRMQFLQLKLIMSSTFCVHVLYACGHIPVILFYFENVPGSKIQYKLFESWGWHVGRIYLYSAGDGNIHLYFSVPVSTSSDQFKLVTRGTGPAARTLQFKLKNTFKLLVTKQSFTFWEPFVVIASQMASRIGPQLVEERSRQ